MEISRDMVYKSFFINNRLFLSPYHVILFQVQTFVGKESLQFYQNEDIISLINN